MYKQMISKAALREIEKAGADGLWNPEYVTYDAAGVKEVGCMRCGTPVMKRMEAVAVCPSCHGQIMVEMPAPTPLPNCARLKHGLPGGSFAELIICTDCLPIIERMDEKEHERIHAQIEAGLIREMTVAGRPQKVIEAEATRIRDLVASKKKER